MINIQKIADLIANETLFVQAVSLAHHGRAASYERLEFLGDRVLGLAVSALLYNMFPKETEGDLAMRFTLLVRERALAQVARHIGLPDVLVTNENELRQNDSILADVCEAVLGALFLSKGFAAVETVVSELWTPLAQTSPTELKDAKSRLQEWAAARKKPSPVYTVTDRSGPDHAPVFTVCVTVDKDTATAQGSSKKNAEERAAESLLTLMKRGKNG